MHVLMFGGRLRNAYSLSYLATHMNVSQGMTCRFMCCSITLTLTVDSHLLWPGLVILAPTGTLYTAYVITSI